MSVTSGAMHEPLISEPLRTFLHEIRSRVVVVGSVARGKRWPKDLDLLMDLDSQQTREAISKGIKKHQLRFVSFFIGSWTFEEYGWQVEIIPVHAGPDYRKVRRHASKQTICGIEFWVARSEDAPPKPAVGSKWRW